MEKIEAKVVACIIAE